MTTDDTNDLAFGREAFPSGYSRLPGELLSQTVERRKSRSTMICRLECMADAVGQWSQLLGDSYVRTDLETLDRFARTTLPNGTRPAVVLQPSSSHDVQAVVRIAARLRVPLHPWYPDANWGYGDGCAPSDGWAIVDLSRMNQIPHVDETLACAVVEPGVTQGQLCQYLRDHHPSLMLDISTDGPTASVVGCTLQRSWGYSPYADRWSRISGLEAVFPDGRILRTGSGGPFSELTTCGPGLERIFCQSHLGFVTRMGLPLLVRPECTEAFHCSVRDDEDLPVIVEAVRALRLRQTILSTVEIANDLRAISTQRTFPSELLPAEAGPVTLPRSLRLQLREQCGVGAWNLYGGICGTEEEVALRKKQLRHSLAPIGSLQFFSRRSLAIARRMNRVSRAVGFGARSVGNLDSAEIVLDLISGVPQPKHRPGLGWRSPAPGAPPDPGQTGLVCHCAIVDATADAARQAAEIVANLANEYQVDPLLTWTSVLERTWLLTIHLTFDPGCHTERLRTKECWQAVKSALETQNFVPARQPWL
ncbi:MAG: FAD-binding oxidoreductase [Planctomycetes bacterium]|nr:FAD-binding oxidoreductase [Planctomycetota bacterium]